MAEELAVFEGTCSTLANAFETAALQAEGNEPHQEMFVEVNDDGLTTPASGADATQASFCTLHDDLFEDISVAEPIAALFPIVEVLEWFAWFDDGATISLQFIGEPGANMAESLRLGDEKRSVTVECVSDPTILEEVEVWLPERFDGTVFLTETGEKAPTKIETAATELNQIVRAVERCEGVERYPVAVSNGELRFEITGERTQVAGTLEATVEGPGFDVQYGPGLARVVRAIEGDVTLYTGPGEPLALVSTQPGLTLRHTISAD